MGGESDQENLLEMILPPVAVVPANVRRQWVTEEFFLNNEKHETTRKNFMEAALTAGMRRTSHEIFSGHLVSFVVKKYHCHPVSVTHYRQTVD